MSITKRLKAFIMWLFSFVCPTDIYLRLNSYDPKRIGEKFSKLAEKLLQEQRNQ